LVPAQKRDPVDDFLNGQRLSTGLQNIENDYIRVVNSHTLRPEK